MSISTMLCRYPAEDSTTSAGCSMFLFINKYRNIKREVKMSQEELRETYKQRLEKEKQSYISKVVKIDASILSKFKTGKIDLYPHLFERLEAYLLNN